MSESTLHQSNCQETSCCQGSEQNVAASESRQSYRPAADVVDLGSEYRVVLDLPGAQRESIDIQFEKGELRVAAQVADRQLAETNYLLREYGVADFRRAFRVGQQVDGDGISADYFDGVLTLHLPKTAAAQPRKIEINVGDVDHD